MEVRALDPEHVYIRLSWLNRPEDLDSGRKDYHGRNELVPTNQIDVIDAMAVNGALEVKHWDEFADEDEKSMPVEDEFFWRQTFDFANTKTFSVWQHENHFLLYRHTNSHQALRAICIDKAPQNPDELIVQCSSGDCRKWMHVRCIAEKALQRARKFSIWHAEMNQLLTIYQWRINQRLNDHRRRRRKRANSRTLLTTRT